MNTIRCCISCILPCGVLDVIRIVHSDGRVEEISGTIKASDVMKAYPKHVLKKPSSTSGEGMVPKIVVVPPEAELRRGHIYFLMPIPPAPQKTRTYKKKIKGISTAANNKKKINTVNGGNDDGKTIHGRRNMSNSSKSNNNIINNNNKNIISMADLSISDQYLSEILSEKLSTQRDRRRGRVGVWRPHLESISESAIDG